MVKDEFYDELIAGARSPVLANLLGPLHARVSVLRATSMSQPGRPLKAVDEIETLTETIACRDAKAASKACTTHIKNAAKAGMRSERPVVGGSFGVAGGRGAELLEPGEAALNDVGSAPDASGRLPNGKPSSRDCPSRRKSGHDRSTSRWEVVLAADDAR